MKLAAHMARRLARTRRRSLVVASASITTLALFVWSPGAWASAGCTTSTPSLGQTIICNVAGTQNITIPDGAIGVELIVIGGGGGGGRGAGGPDPNPVVPGGDGGEGARVVGNFALEGGGTLNVTVGQGGAGGVGAGDARGGGGGGFSRVQFGGTTDLIIAGGGGGGGFAPAGGGAGGAGGAGGSAAGGAGGSDGGVDGGMGGAGASGGAGGAGVGASQEGSRGSNYVTGGGAGADGAGGSGGDGSGGGGGGGYGGGGGGGRSSTNRGGGGAGGSFANEDLLIGEASFSPSTDGAGSGGQGGPDGSGAGEGKPGTAGWIQIRFIFIPSNTSGTPTQRSLVLTFDLPEGVNCSFKNVEASLGTWVQLPGAQDCTTSSADGPTLLGWATQADFPVQIAQRQVTNGWGAYETFNESGALTGVFIPAGGFTVLSADTGLYPIWS